MSKYKISIIIPTYNAENYINRCIDSLFNQTFNFNDLEIILIDDCSTDSTKEIISNLSLKYENIITIFNEQNSGSPSKPRNIGIDNATADYIMFMDNDDYYYPDMCEVMYNTIINENVDIVSCRPILNKNNQEEIKEKTFLDDEDDFVKLNSIDDFPQLMSSGVTMLIWNKIFKRNLIKSNKIQFPEKILYEDVYFMIQSYLKANGIVLLNNFWGYSYIIRTKGENKSTSFSYTENNLVKQFLGLKKILNLLETENVNYPSLECEMIAGWTKLFIFTNLKDDKKRELLFKSKEIYSHYKLFVRLNNIPLVINIILNIFIKLFSLNISFAIMITNLINFFRLKIN